MRIIRIMIIVTVMIEALIANAFAVEYKITDLGAIDLPVWGWASNSAGHMAGYFTPANSYSWSSATWDGNDVHQLDTPENIDYALIALNDSDLAIGWCGGFRTSSTVFTWNGSTITELPKLGQWAESADINNAGQIVGFGTIGTNNNPFALMWDSAGVHALEIPDGVTNSGANEINENGVVVGAAGDGRRLWAERWDSAGAHALFTPEGMNSEAYGINENGETVGYVVIGVDRVPCIWDRYGNFRMLSDQPGIARWINNSGIIVGKLYTEDGTYARACYWDENGVHYLEQLGGIYGTACGINELGQIFGTSVTETGETHAVVWNPVPEPSSLAVLISAIGALAGCSMKKYGRTKE